MEFTTQSSGGNGYLQTRGIIENYEIKYGVMNESLMKPFDVSIVILLDKGALSFNPKIFLEGNFTRDAANKIVNDKEMYRIRQFFNACGFESYTVDPDGTIPKAFLDQLIGKEVSIIKYVYGTKKGQDGKMKAAWKNWWKIVSPKDSVAQMSEFMKKISDPNAKGFIKDFKPDAAKVESENTLDFPPAAPTVNDEAF